jgi:hypothetical protein
MNTTCIVLLAIVGMLFYCSAFEWKLHKDFMHKPFLGVFEYPFRQHAQVHHQIFKADKTYHLQDPKHRRTIRMAWWNWLVLIPAALILPALLALFSGHFLLITLTCLIVVMAYYTAYEWFHWCMHMPLPRQRLTERYFIPFKWLNGHHLLHHRYMHRNFNVVLPVMDLLTGTLLLRSPIKFAQPRGPLVPDVQPREKAGRAPIRSSEECTLVE